MTDIQIILIVVFLLTTVIGYLIIRNVPSLLHTPLMSGINALSGITIVGALLAFAIALKGNPVSSILGALAIVVASANVIGGLGVTDRILKMFTKDKNNDK